jgi:hypothetical protein
MVTSASASSGSRRSNALGGMPSESVNEFVPVQNRNCIRGTFPDSNYGNIVPKAA